MRTNKSVRQPPTSADNMTLLAFVFERRAAVLLRRPAAAAIDRYLLPAGPTAANPLQRRAVVERWQARIGRGCVGCVRTTHPPPKKNK